MFSCGKSGSRKGLPYSCFKTSLIFPGFPITRIGIGSLPNILISENQVGKDQPIGELALASRKTKLISLKTHKGIGLNLDLYFHKTPKVTMNWESYVLFS